MRLAVGRRVDASADLGDVMARLGGQVNSLPQTAGMMFLLGDEGFDSVFEQVVASIVSVRTYEEVTLPACRRLFDTARTPAEVANLGEERVNDLIAPATYHEAKARQIVDIAVAARDEYGGELSCDYDALIAFRGVGPKVANLAIAVACAEPHGVPVDVHVQRVTNRWGLVETRNPESTRKALEKILPRRHWATINRLLVPFGKFVCTASRPRCSACCVRDDCERVGVSDSR